MKKLVQLIDSLTMNEKRFFVLNTSSKSALSIFNILNNGNSNEKLSDFSSRDKNYLFEILLKSLRNYHSSSSINRRLDDYVHEIDILINKELYETASERIRKAQKMAIKFEKTYHQIILTRLKYRAENPFGKKDTNPQKYYKAIGELSQLLFAGFKMEEVINTYYQNSYVVPVGFFEKKTQEILSPLNKHLQIKIKNSLLYNRIMSFTWDQHLDFEKSKGYYHVMLEMYRKGGSLLSNSMVDLYSNLNYIAILHSYMNVLKKANRLDEYLEAVKIFEQIKGVSSREKKRSFANITISLTDFFISRNEVQKGIEFVEKNKKQAELLSLEYDRGELLFFNLAYIYFLDKRYRMASRYLKKIFLMVPPRFKFIYNAAYLFYIIVQFEMQEAEHGLQLIKTYNKKISKVVSPSVFDNLVLGFLKEFYGNESVEKAALHYRKLAEHIKKISTTNMQANLNTSFNFLGWMRFKLEGAPFQHANA